MLAIPHSDASNHNGGQLQFGPDGKLWLATGDGGGGNNPFGHSQDPASRLGKLLRLDPTQTPIAVEQLSQGLRNPWRFSFAPDGRIVIADVGQGQYEEINVGLAANYGWPCREGAHDYLSDPGCNGVATADPVLEKAHGATTGSARSSAATWSAIRACPTLARPVHLRRQLRQRAAIGRPGEPGGRRGDGPVGDRR